MWVGAKEEEEAEKAEEEQTQALERGRAPGNKEKKGHKREQAIEAKAEDARQNK